MDQCCIEVLLNKKHALYTHHSKYSSSTSPRRYFTHRSSAKRTGRDNIRRLSTPSMLDLKVTNFSSARTRLHPKVDGCVVPQCLSLMSSCWRHGKRGSFLIASLTVPRSPFPR